MGCKNGGGILCSSLFEGCIPVPLDVFRKSKSPATKNINSSGDFSLPYSQIDLFPAHLASSSCCYVQPNICQRVVLFSKETVQGRNLNVMNCFANKCFWT